MAKITDIEGVGPAFAQKLSVAGIRSTQNLLEQGATPKGRSALAEKSGLSQEQILKWVNHADLFRIKGVAGQYSDLLESAGVDSVSELAKRKPENLYQKMVEVNQQKHLVRNLPSLNQVEAWVTQAKQLPRVVTY